MQRLRTWLMAPHSTAPLATFRVVFGAVMLYSVIRFAVRGWITAQYVDPQFYFPYLGLEFIKPLGFWGMHGLFLLMGLAALGIMLGYRYRLSALLFFLCFTYVELIDKTNYLNHYYFVSLVSFWLLWVPAHATFSLDARRNPSLAKATAPRYTVLLLQLQLALVYFYAGVAKLNTDWLLEAMPLRLWLPSRTDLPIIGQVLGYTWVAYAFSWFGAIYDLTIAAFLWYRPTRKWAYAAVVAFHVLTRILFPIGVFPWVMIGATLIFFSPNWHLRWQKAWQQRFGRVSPPSAHWQPTRSRMALGMLSLLLCIQVLLPWRYLLYPGNLFWTEEGYRFSWRVMLMEKAGYLTYDIVDPATGRSMEVDPQDYLTPVQVKMLATQPDMILQFAHFLAAAYEQQGIAHPEVYAHSYVSLQGRRSRPFIDPKINLAAQPQSWKPKTWIMPSPTPSSTVANR